MPVLPAAAGGGLGGAGSRRWGEGAGHEGFAGAGRTALTEEEEAWAGRVWTILPARWRAAAWLTEAERDFAPSFLDMVNQELEKVKRLYSTTGRLYDKVPVSGDAGDACI